MQVGRDAVRLERARLGGPAAGDQGERRPVLADARQLLLAQLGRHEAEDADAPRTVAELRGRLRQERVDLVAAHQGQGEEREGAALGDGGGEAGAVADARHRALHERVARAVRGRERRALGQRVGGPRGGALGDRRLRERVDDAGHGPVAGQVGGEAGVLADREHGVVQAAPVHHGLDRRAPLRGRGVPRHQLALGRRQRGGGREVGAHVRPERRAEVRAEARRLAAVERGDARLRRLVERRLAGQQDLGVEHGARGAGHDAGGGGVAAHAALHPERHAERGAEPLQQHERALLADPAGRLVALGHDPVGPRGDAGERRVQARRDDERLRAVRAGERDLRGDVVPAQQDDVERPRGCRQDGAQQRLVARDLDAEAAPPAVGHRAHRGERRVAVTRDLQVEHPERAGPAGGDGQARVRAPRRREDREVERAGEALRLDDGVFRDYRVRPVLLFRCLTHR